MRQTARYTLYIIVALLLAGCSGCQKHAEESQPQTARDSVSIVKLISRQSRLYTTEYVVHKIVTHNDIHKVKGTFLGRQFDHELPLGDRKIAIPIDVTLQAYIDLSGITEKDVIRKDSFLYITLPDPRIVITSSKVDNHGIRKQVGLFRSNFSDAELTNFTQQGSASVLYAVPQMGIIESARNNAAMLLFSLLADMGYDREHIVVTFRKEFGQDDLKDIYDNELSVIKLTGK